MFGASISFFVLLPSWPLPLFSSSSPPSRPVSQGPINWNRRSVRADTQKNTLRAGSQIPHRAVHSRDPYRPTKENADGAGPTRNCGQRWFIPPRITPR